MSLSHKVLRPTLRLIALASLALLLGTANVSANSFTFAALPGPGVSHTTPGSTVGWGYSITNNSTTDWLVVYGLTAPASPYATPNPYFFDFPSIAPGTSRIVPYNPFSPYGYSFMAANGFPHPVKNLPYNPVTNPFNALGLYEATISSNAPMGALFSGNFVISAEWFNGDPDTNPVAQPLGFAGTASAPFQTQVTPEPASLTLFGIGIFGVAFGLRRNSKKLR